MAGQGDAGCLSRAAGLVSLQTAAVLVAQLSPQRVCSGRQALCAGPRNRAAAVLTFGIRRLNNVFGIEQTRFWEHGLVQRG